MIILEGFLIKMKNVKNLLFFSLTENNNVIVTTIDLA